MFKTEDPTEKDIRVPGGPPIRLNFATVDDAKPSLAKPNPAPLTASSARVASSSLTASAAQRPGNPAAVTAGQRPAASTSTSTSTYTAALTALHSGAASTNAAAMPTPLAVEAALGERSVSLQVLTGKGGRFAIPVEQQEMLCLTSDGTLHISAAHINNPHVLAFMERLTRNKLRFRLKKSSFSDIKALYQSYSVNDENAQDISREQAHVVRIIHEASEAGASDVHFIIGLGSCHIRMRVDGELRTQHELSPVEGRALCATIYQSMCDVADPIFNPGRSQDARLKRLYLDQCGLYGARVATRPTDSGLLMVLRLLYNRQKEKPTLETLGYLKEQIALIERMSSRKNGVNIIAGPTGSGKSTTLECLMSSLVQRFQNRVHLLTIEDPPEYKIEGSVQTPILGDKTDDEEISREWARAIANSMRLDPDIIMVGEVRDLSSAKALMRAAMTGHGVWATVHANDAISILERLRDIGIELNMLADPALMTGLISQVLARRLCNHCRQPLRSEAHRLPKDLIERIGIYCHTESVYLRGPGCNACKQTGVSGRIVIAEALIPTKAIMNCFRLNGKNEAKTLWAKEMGGITKNQHLIRRINEGLIDPEMGEHDVCPLDEDMLTL